MAADGRNSSFLLALGLAALFLSPLEAPEPRAAGRSAAPVAPSATASASNATEQSTPSEIDKWCDDRLKQVFDDYLGPKEKATPCPHDGLPQLRTDAKATDVLIATVPDPVDSGHDHYFDRVSEAVERAVAADGDVHRDRSWLPWVDVESTDPERSLACRKTHPGVVLYRPADPQLDRRKGALLLLVGESPTFGVHRKALASAFAIAECNAPAGPFDIRLAGPTFSGSASSIRWTIADWWPTRSPAHPDLAFTIISGSATAETVETTLRSESAPRITFDRRAVADGALSCSFYDFLQKTLGVEKKEDGKGGCVLPQVAMLSESVTEYGKTHRSDKDNGQRHARRAPRKCCQPEFEAAFPPNLSSIRSAYAASAESAPRDPLNEQLPKTSLATSLRDERPPRDIEPNLSTQTTVARDLALAQILDQIARLNVSYVGIVATDVNDTIFLASQIRKTSSDVRLFTFSSDIMYSHPAYAIDLKGMLVASPYPFFGAHRFERSVTSFDVFTGDVDEGSYEAVLALRRSDVSDKRPPPTWISALSGGKVWPLAVNRDPKPSKAPRAWVLFFLVCTALGAFHAIEIVRLPRRAPSRRSSSSPLRVLQRCARSDFASEQAAHRFAFAALVTTIQLLACWTFDTFAFDDHDPTKLLSKAGGLVATALVVVTGWCLFECVRPFVTGAPGHAADRGPTLGRVAAYGAMVAFFWTALWKWLTNGTLSRPLLADRTASVLSGVSPMAVLLSTAAIGYVWILCHLERLHDLDCGQTLVDATPIADVLQESESGLHRAERALCRALARPGSLRGGPAALFWSVALGLGSVAVVILMQRPIVTLEEYLWGARLLRYSLLLAIGVLCLTIARLTVFVVYLRALLRSLRRHPSVGAFCRIPSQLRRSVEAQTMGRWDSADITVCIQLLDALALHRDRAELTVEDAPGREELSTFAQEARRALEGEHGDAPESVLGMAARRVLHVLTPFWSATANPAGAVTSNAIANPTDAIARWEALVPPATLSWLRVAEELQASLVTLRLGRLLRQFRHFVTALISGALLLILAVSLYAFEPRRPILGVVFFLTLGIAWLTLGTLFLLDRDPVTSAIAGKPAGQVKWTVDLVRRVVTWGLIPILGAFAALYPEPSRVIFAWLDPLRRALSGSF